MSEASAGMENIRALYEEALQNHRLLSQAIVIGTVSTIVVNAGIWAFCIKEYIDTTKVDDPGRRYPEGWYLFVAPFLCSLVVILWRWYAHFLDNRVVRLYPELVDYEARLGLSGSGTTWNHLKQRVFKKCTEQEKRELRNKAAIRNLVDKRKIGLRGHLAGDVVALVYIPTMWRLDYGILWHKSPGLTGISLICFVAFPIAWGCVVAKCAQMDPAEVDIEAAIAAKDGETEEGAGEIEPPEDAVEQS